MKGRLPSLDGWRAVSILIVLGDHTLTGWFPWKHLPLLPTFLDGNLGVRFFFGISGFLITWLMLKEEVEFKNVSLKNFYIRRTLRIWPVYIAFLLVLFCLQKMGIVYQSMEAWRGLLTFTRNFHDDVREAGDAISIHCWSLSIEEQFYLVWPLVFCFAGRRGRVGFLIFTILFSAGFRTIVLLGAYDRHHAHYLFYKYATFNYTDCLAWGCLGAFILAAKSIWLETFAGKRPVIVFSVCFSLILIPALAQLGRGLQAAGFIGLLLHSVVSPQWMFYRALNWGWMKKIGVLSYSIYLWNQFFWMLWPPALAKWWFLWLPIAIGIAWLSYSFLEKPFLGLRAKYRLAPIGGNGTIDQTTQPGI